METMYTNRISLTVNDKEAFFHFELVTPEIGEDHKITSEKVEETRTVMMTRETLEKVKDLIDECLEGSKKV